MKYKKGIIISLIISLLSFLSSWIIFILNKPELGTDAMGAPIEYMYNNPFGDLLFYVGIVFFVIFLILLVLSFVHKKK